MNAYDFLHRVGFRTLMRWLYRIEVVGGERIPPSGPASSCANHESIGDPFILGVATTAPDPLHGEGELFRCRPIAAALRSLNTFPVERGSGDTAAVTEAARLLQGGAVLGVFPQGTSKQLERRWHRGAARLALVTGAPLVPVRMTGTRGWPLRTHVRIEVGEPIEVEPAKPSVAAARELTRRLEEAVLA